MPLTWEFRALLNKDLKVFNIEYNMTLLDKQPTFWVYYCTSKADVLGRLILSETDLIFEPMNENFKGWRNYASRPAFTRPRSLPRPPSDEPHSQLRRRLHPRVEESHHAHRH